ncbi:MAG: beta-N-acetylhexosaminidase [Chitinophagales bacterium]
MRRNLTILLLFIGYISLQSQQYGLIPKPFSTKVTGPKFTMKGTQFVGYCPDSFFNIQYVKKFMKSNDTATKFTRIDLEVDTSEAPKDNFKMRIFKNDITIKAGKVGAFYALQALKKMDENGNLAEGEIMAGTRAKYRGMHLDVCRHFFPVEEVKKYIDMMARYQFNYFHWHLTEDQGWRIEIKKYPKLTEIGSKRSGTLIGRQTSPEGDGNYDNIPVSGYYTQEQIKEVVAYAKERFITVVPEIDMPGHMLAAIASYPHLSCTGKPVEVGKRWGVYDEVLCPCQESTYKFVEDVLDEVIALFPSEYIHIGGDEVVKTTWKNSTQCASFMKENRIRDVEELQSYFIKRVEKYVNSKGRKIIGWDEILEGGLAPNATVMSWRGEEGGIAAAKAKHNAIMTPGKPLYFDHAYSKSKEEPVNIGGKNTLEDVYNYKYSPFSYYDTNYKYILGAQGNVWTEYMKNWKKVEYMVYPRMQALSEIFWIPDDFKNMYDFYERLGLELEWMDKQGIHYRIPEPIGFMDTLGVNEKKELNLWPICKKHKVSVWVDEQAIPLSNNILILEPEVKSRIVKIVVSNETRSSLPYYIYLLPKK